jgi:hypothetical protein
MTKSMLHFIGGKQENFLKKVDIDVHSTHRCILHINVDYTYMYSTDKYFSWSKTVCTYSGKGMKENDVAV